MVKVSVCLAAYNGARFLGRQLESIVRQLQPTDEIIIVDDASSDATVSVIESMNDGRIRLLRHDTNAGVAATFHHALLHATGDVIFLSDQDDVWLPGKVEAVLERIAAGSDLVVHDAVVVQDGKVVHASRFGARNSGPGVWRNLVRNSYSGCCMAFRRTLLRDVLPIPRRNVFHDVWIGMTAELSGRRVEFLPRPLIEHTRHGANVSSAGGGRWLAALAERATLIAALLRFLIGRRIRGERR